MSDSRSRQHKNEAFFNVYELAALEPVLTRLGKGIGDFSIGSLRDLLSLHYNQPHEHRGDVNRVLAGLRLAGQTLGTIRRHETGVHATNPEFRLKAVRIIDGDPDGITYETVRGLRGLLDDLVLFAERGC